MKNVVFIYMKSPPSANMVIVVKENYVCTGMKLITNMLKTLINTKVTKKISKMKMSMKIKMMI